MVLHGSSRTTQDFDICYERSPTNLQALAAALSPFHTTLRGAPADLPFRLDAATLRSGLNFTLRSPRRGDWRGRVPGTHRRGRMDGRLWSARGGDGTRQPRARQAQRRAAERPRGPRRNRRNQAAPLFLIIDPRDTHPLEADEDPRSGLLPGDEGARDPGVHDDRNALV